MICLFCPREFEFKSADAARAHMLDKGHCFMNSEITQDFFKFYDFSPKKIHEVNMKK